MQDRDRPYAMIVVLGTLCVVLAILLVDASLRRVEPDQVDRGLRDDSRSAVEVAAMVAAVGGAGIWDSHPDADVARVLQPNIHERLVLGRRVSSNLQGMREETVVLPKPLDTVRLVLLGDSFVYGLGVEADERMGVHLQRFLNEHTAVEGKRIEVLHFGLSSWNLISECAFLRRQLALLQPDLVIHLTVRNDLADTLGARGFGAMSTFAPRLPSRADGAMRPGFALWSLHERAFSMLPMGLDHESRVRFEEAADAVALLARTVVECGGDYLHVFHWGTLNTVPARRIAPRLMAKQVLYLPQIFVDNPDWRLSSGDEHWNPTGHGEVARLLFGAIVHLDLLADLELSPWPEAAEWAREMATLGREQAHKPAALPRPVGNPAVDMSKLTPLTASQVHAGIARDGTLSPYASLLLRNRTANLLVVEGACLNRPELNGKTVAISLDEVTVGEIKLRAGKKVKLTMRMPKQLRDRPCLTLRFVADDYVYAGEDLRQCVSFRLRRARLVQ